MKRRILEFLKEDDGPTTVEYAVMIALIVMGCFGTILGLGQATNSSFMNAQNQINQAINGAP